LLLDAGTQNPSRTEQEPTRPIPDRPGLEQSPIRAGAGSPTHCRLGQEQDPWPSVKQSLGWVRADDRDQWSSHGVILTCWDCRWAGGNQHGQGTGSLRSCPTGPYSDGFILNRLEVGTLGCPVLAGNLIYDPDGRRRHSWPSSSQGAAGAE